MQNSMIIPMSMERVTVTLPVEIVRDIDRLDKNRSKFVLDAVRQELRRRRRAELRRSLRRPHVETTQLADAGLDEWAKSLPDEESLVDPKGGVRVRWVPGEGWVEAKR